MMLYTWKDVERVLLLNKHKWKGTFFDIETYVNEIIIYIEKEQLQEYAENILSDILDKHYSKDSKKIFLDLPGECLNIFFEVEEDTRRTNITIPLFRNVLYQQSAYYENLIEEELPGVPVLAFHSYKGGVGRTLSLLAFVKAWSTLKNVKNPRKLLIVDADIEAPGIT